MDETKNMMEVMDEAMGSKAMDGDWICELF